MSSNTKIAGLILQLLQKEIVFTDIQIKPGAYLTYRAPRGYVRMEEGDLITEEDIIAFASMADKDYEKRLIAEGGQFDVAFNIMNKSRLRCNFFTEGNDNKISISLRILQIEIPELSSLGVDVKLKSCLYSNSQGLILITGPMGSGKTTTQFSLLQDLNKSAPVHIVTIEQPIEYEMKSDMGIVTQREVLKNVPSFSKAMYAARRQRPEIIMIGEIRDKDTVETVLEASESGIIVIAGIHAKGPEDAIETLLKDFSGNDLVSKRTQLSNSLLAINSQRLLPSLDGKRNILVYDLLINTQVIATSLRKNEINSISELIKNNNGGDSVPLIDVLKAAINSGKISAKDAIVAARTKEDKEYLTKTFASKLSQAS